MNKFMSGLHDPSRLSRLGSAMGAVALNIDIEKRKFAKTSTSKEKPPNHLHIQNLIFASIEQKTLIFDFDETLAKVDVGAKKLPSYDD